MMKKTLLLLPAAMLSVAAMAETVTPEEALDVALGFLHQPARARGQQDAQSLTLAHTAQADGETYYYVFNNPMGGYVVVSGDDVAHKVLAYSEDGTFDYAELAPATRWWLSQYQSQIHHAIAAERQGLALSPAKAGGSASWPEVEPLLGGIEWDQMAPYNAYVMDNSQIPDVWDQYCTGCAATATAQVMRYWGYPERGMGRNAYMSKGTLLEANFAEHQYQWQLMQEKYENAYSGKPEENAVAQLLSDVGIALNMSYGTPFGSGSGTFSSTILYALRTYFGYNPEMEYVMRDAFDSMPDGMWEECVYSELAQGRPVIYGGSGPGGAGAHTFVCDGYKDGFFHINWGWSGRGNHDYFLLTATQTTPALSPNEEGVGGNSLGQYGYCQEIIIGIQPDPQSEGFVRLAEPIDVPAEVPYGPLHYEAKLYNPTSQDIKALVSIHLQDDNGIFLDEEHVVDVADLYLIPAKQEVKVTIDVPEEKLIPGLTYKTMFMIADVTSPEIDEEMYPMIPCWAFACALTRVEGPEHVLVSLANSGVSTLCVPFDAELPEGIEAFTAVGIEDGNAVIMKQAASIEAGKAYVLLCEEPMEEPFLLSGMRKTDGVWSQDLVFKGNMTSEKQPHKGDYYAFTNDDDGHLILARADGPVGVPAHKVIIDGSVSDADVLFICFDDSATGIQHVSELRSSLRYNLVGQPLHSMRGLVIEGGRVCFVR